MLARRWLDDFGRLVALQYRGQAIAFAGYLEGSERIALLTDAAGTVSHLGCNARGQVESLRRVDAAGKPAGRIEYRHKGAWLVEQLRYEGGAPGGVCEQMSRGKDGISKVVGEF